MINVEAIALTLLVYNGDSKINFFKKACDCDSDFAGTERNYNK